MGALLVVGVLPARAQTADIASIMARMQEIITEMQSLQAEFAELSDSLGAGNSAATPSTAAAPSGSVLGAATTVLQQEAVYGETNDTILKIQTLLATDPLIYPDGITSGFYGPKTQDAIRNLQARFGMDPVGVVGPSTAALIMEYFVAYPGGSYPSDVLQSRPSTRTGAEQSAAPTTAPAPTPAASTPTVSDNPIDRIFLNRDDDETLVRVTLVDGGAFGLITDTRDEEELIEAIAERGDIAERYVAAVIDMGDLRNSRQRDDDDDEDEEYDEDDADDAIDDARNAVRDARNAIRDAEDMGVDEDDLEDAQARYEDARDELDDAEDDFDDNDYSDAYRNAERATELAEEAIEMAEDESEIDEDMADDMLDDADDAIDDADDAIDRARANGDDVDDAEELLEDAKNELDDAEDDFDDEDWEDAYEKAERAIELAEEAEDAL